MADDLDDHDHGEVPDGAAVFPEIPAELGVHPLTLALVHAVVFLAGSADEIVHPEAGEEALQRIADYLQRLSGPDLRRIEEDAAALVGYGKQQRWPKQIQHFLKSFLADFGVGESPE